MLTDSGTKFDAGKPPIGLLPRAPVEAVARVLAHGEEKYGRHNWRRGISQQRLLNAALRHIFAYNDGETYDTETGESHLAHAICMLMFAEELRDMRPDLDDRWAGKNVSEL